MNILIQIYPFPPITHMPKNDLLRYLHVLSKVTVPIYTSVVCEGSYLPAFLIMCGNRKRFDFRTFIKWDIIFLWICSSLVAC